MTSRTNIIRTAFALIGALAVTGLAAPAALADPPQGHRADVSERLVQSERAGTAGTDQTARFVGRDRPDGYQPGRRSSPSGGASASDGFAWSDAGIGAGVGIAFVLLAGGALISLRTRQRVAHS